MNDRYAAGTGWFIEVIANVMGGNGEGDGDQYREHVRDGNECGENL